MFRAVNILTGKSQQPIRLDISATGDAVNFDFLAVIGFMREVDLFCFF